METINFLATDGISLNGILYKSQNKTESIILAVHGMSSSCFRERDEVISKHANEADIDYFCFNNRGSELVKYIRNKIDDKKMLGGTTYEDVLEGYEDIVGAILKLKELGYKKIYLQGHSLGCTKIVYTYNELKDEKSNDILESIKGVILLSLVDIPTAFKTYLGSNFDKYLELAEEMERKGKTLELMPKEACIHPISVKSFLKYVRDNKEIDFARYEEDTKLEKLNNIDIPLFMRWGNTKEMITQEASELTSKVNKIILNKHKDINYIDGADHGYHRKEEELAEQIIKFIEKNNIIK